MSDGAAFLLEPSHLGRNALGEVSLHADLSERLSDLIGAAGYDLLDADGMRLATPPRPFEFTAAVEPFEVDATAPRRLAVYEAAGAADVAAAFPALRREKLAEPEGIVFELEDRHLGVDAFGLTHLAPGVARALDACRERAPETRVQLFEGDGVPHADRPTSFSEHLAPLAAGPHAEVVLNGFEPRYLAFADAAAAEDFLRSFPGLRRWRLADLERLWRLARREAG